MWRQRRVISRLPKQQLLAGQPLARVITWVHIIYVVWANAVKLENSFIPYAVVLRYRSQPANHGAYLDQSCGGIPAGKAR
jgi:hypothetical protein